MKPTKPDVFIIESLNPDDEGNGRFEGSIISNMLRLHGKEPKYRYVRTRKEFESAVKAFAHSRYRYLHISAHGNTQGMCTTNQEAINYEDLADLLKPSFKRKRLFLSACSMVHCRMAKHLIQETECHSVIGPADDIEFHKAAIFWASLYHLLFLNNPDKMNHTQLKNTLSKAENLFEVNMKFFARSGDNSIEDILHADRSRL